MLYEIALGGAIALKILLTLLTAAFIWSIWSSRKSKIDLECTIPGPALVDEKNGHLPDIAQAGGFSEYLVQLHQENGPIAKFYLAEQLIVSTANHCTFEPQTRLFNRPFALFSMFEPLITRQSLQYANNEDAMQRRRNYNKHFSHLAMYSYEAVAREVGEQLCSTWKKTLATTASSQSADIDLEEPILNLALRSVARCCFGDIFYDEAVLQDFRQGYMTTFTALEHWLRTGTAAAPETDDSAESVQFREGKNKCYAIIRQLIQTRRATKDNQLLFLDHLMEYCQQDDLLECETLTFIIGGFHTTGYALIFLIYYLAKHVQCQRLLREEIQRCCLESEEDDVNATGDCLTLSWSQLHQLPYLRSCIDESLRLSQLAPFAARVSEEEVVLGGHRIPPNTPIVQALGVSFMDPSVFSDPTEFRPERFLDPLPPHAFEPFGLGQRKCPAYRFAYMELSLFIAQILVTFEFKLANEIEETLPRSFGLVTKPAQPVVVNFKLL